MKIESREYKLLVQHESFNQPAEAVASIWNEIEETVRTLPGIRTKGTFDEKDVRSIQFLDTPGHSLRGNGLVLRRRSDDQTVEKQ
jgi:inorganic triphosphatase YgiF